MASDWIDAPGLGVPASERSGRQTAEQARQAVTAMAGKQYVEYPISACPALAGYIVALWGEVDRLSARLAEGKRAKRK